MQNFKKFEKNQFVQLWIVKNMIFKDIKLFSQNVQKNSLIIKTILEVKSNFDIIFI